MKKVLIYVDGENVSEQQFENFNNSFTVDDNERVIGKLYGDHLHIGSVMEKCIASGYDYVDTHMLATTSKNVADMKIVVDCMDDVHNIFRDDVSRIIILSSDHDFIPLMLKMINTNHKIELPLLHSIPIRVTIKDLNLNLRNVGFTRSIKGKLFDSVFNSIRDVCDNVFSDSLLEEYIALKRNNFLRDWTLQIDSDDFDKIMKISPKDFSLLMVMQVLNLNKMNEKFVNDYTCKIFGSCLCKKNLTSKEIELIEWSE